MIMESTWLKSEYTSDCPPSKRTKFSEVSAELHSHFPKKKYSSLEVSRLIRDTFPGTESKACGKSRQKHILGLERITTSSQPGSNAQCSSSETIEPEHTASHTLDYSDLLIENQQLKARVIGYSDLLIENQRLKTRLQELEKTSPTSLCHQADAIIHHKSPVTQGPSSLDSFHELDLASIIAELKFRAPDLYHLYVVLGDTQRNRQNEDVQVTTEEVKVVASMCSMLNARSARMKGLQLLVSFMLVARATCRQVCSVTLLLLPTQ